MTQPEPIDTTSAMIADGLAQVREDLAHGLTFGTVSVVYEAEAATGHIQVRANCSECPASYTALVWHPMQLFELAYEVAMFRCRGYDHEPDTKKLRYQLRMYAVNLSYVQDLVKPPRQRRPRTT
jgi:hypothetical protein